MGGRAIVIGGGITGTLSAVRLRRAGWEVTVLEAHHVGAGSSSRTAAGIRQQFSTPETVLGMRYSVDVYRRFPEEVGGLVSPIVQNGYLFLIRHNLEAARDRVAVQRSAGLAEVELLSPGAAQERFPFVDPEHLKGACWCPTDGFLRPEVVYGEAAASARAWGVTLLQGRAVVEARLDGSRIAAVRARQEWHEADVFVDATNAWSPRLARVLGAADLPIAPTKRYLWFISRDGSLTGQELLAMPMVVTPDGAYCHPENAETMMTGWAHQAEPEPEFTLDDQDRVDAGFDHRSGVDGRGYDTWFSLAEYIPQLGEFAGVHATTCGYYGVTPDHNPFLGFDPLRTNLIRACGFSGHGAMFGPFTARVVEALAAAGRDLDSVKILGRDAALEPFRTTRDFVKGESMVI